MTVPTNDTQVRLRLRQLGHPITLFGERQPGRRERLGSLLAKIALEDGGGEAELSVEDKAQATAEAGEKKRKAFLTQGPPSLLKARTAIAHFGLQAAQKRLRLERQSTAAPSRYEPHPSLKSYTAVASTLGDQRPISSCAFSPSSTLLATSSWSGLCKVWSIPSCSERLVMRGHTFNATDVVWHPKAESSQSPTSVNLASCGMDGRVLLWPLEPPPLDSDIDNDADMTSAFSSSSSTSPATPMVAPLAVLSPHSDRCARVAFHPSGDWLYSTSYDTTYQLHDVQTMTSIYSQPGHSYPVYSLSTHPDGSLLLTGDTGGVAHAWDCRMPRIALSLVGHARAVLCSDWTQSGWTVCTGSEDNTVRVWDIRGKKCMYVLPAHRKLVSGCKWMRGEWEVGGRSRVSECLVTCGYDGLVKVWDGHAMTLVRELKGHDRMVMRVSVAKGTDGHEQWFKGRSPYIASASYDRTWKLWNVAE